MKKCLTKRGYDLYDPKDSPNILAEKALKVIYNKEIQLQELPIDPFKALKSSGAYYRFFPFDSLEGIYLLPIDLQDPDSLASVGLKLNSETRLTRLRFTAAHELCHHLKDEDNIVSRQQENNPIEKYANQFAGSFLMPNFLLKKSLADKNITKESLNFNDFNILTKIFEISIHFQVSFESTLIRVKNCFNIMGFIDFKTIVEEFEPDTQAKKYNEERENQIICLEQIINSGNYEVSPMTGYKAKFLDCLIRSDHRIEIGSLSPEDIEKQLAIIRLYSGNKKAIEKCIKNKCFNKADMFLLGEYDMYQSIVFKGFSKNPLNIILELNKFLFKYVPYPYVGGSTRGIAARITGKTVILNSPEEIPMNLKNAVEKHSVDSFLSLGHALKSFSEDHHTLTVIHPFIDGNGRTSRAFLNMQLDHVGLPMIYIKEEKRDDYQRALEYFDDKNDCLELFKFFCFFIMNEYLTYDSLE